MINLLDSIEEVIEKVLLISVHEIRTDSLYELARYAEAKANGYTVNTWTSYKPKAGADGMHHFGFDVISIFMSCESSFSIEIKDAEAEKINTITDLLNLVQSKINSINN